MSDYVSELKNLDEKIKEAWRLLGIDSIALEIKEGELIMAHPDFWSDRENSRIHSQKVRNLKNTYEIWLNLRNEVEELLELSFLESHQSSIANEITERYEELVRRYDVLAFQMIMSDPYDRNDAIVSLHAGSGGTDAQDWAQMLLRMILRYSERKMFTVEMIDQSFGGEAGVKSCSFKVQGNFAYGYLKSEHGVHRLVRISPFDAEKMRHTSFALIDVLPLLEDIDMNVLDFQQKDLRVDTYRASGAGGQHVNKTESAVRITHIPTGLVVACQSERSQTQNREVALKILKSKLFQYYQSEREDERKRLRGEYTEAAWGNQIRSYVLHPYKLVKDSRSGYETREVQSVLDGDLDSLIESYLRSRVGNKNI